MNDERYLASQDSQFTIQRDQYLARGAYHRDTLLNSRLPFDPNRLRFDLCLSMLPEDFSDVMVLGVGAGDCALESILTDRGANVTAFDPIPEAISLAHKADKRLHLAVANAASIPFMGNIFDYVTMLETLEHIPDHQEIPAIQEIHRVLKNNSTLLISVPSDNIPVAKKHYRHYSFDTLTSLLVSNGFDLEEVLFYRQFTSKHRGLLGKLSKGKQYLDDWINRLNDSSNSTSVCSESEATGIIVKAKKLI